MRQRRYNPYEGEDYGDWTTEEYRDVDDRRNAYGIRICPLNDIEGED